MSEKTFKHELGATVRIKASGETGTVEGRAEYTSAQPTYYLHYKAADGRAVSDWVREGLIEAA